MDWTPWVIIAAVAAALGAVVWMPLRRSWNAGDGAAPGAVAPSETGSGQDDQETHPQGPGEDE